MVKGIRFLLPLFVLAYLIPTSSIAQNWTPEQQEIIDLNQACWEAWASEDVNQMRRICNEHPESTGWYTPNAAPVTGWFEKHGEQWVNAFYSRSNQVYLEIIPLAVSLFDNTAMIFFWATHTDEAENGELTTSYRKQLNIWQKMDGNWTWIGGMIVLEGNDG